MTPEPESPPCGCHGEHPYSLGPAAPAGPLCPLHAAAPALRDALAALLSLEERMDAGLGAGVDDEEYQTTLKQARETLRDAGHATKPAGSSPAVRRSRNAPRGARQEEA